MYLYRYIHIVYPKSNDSKSMVYYIKNFQNMILMRRYIVSNEIFMRRRHHGRLLLECPPESWLKIITFIGVLNRGNRNKSGGRKSELEGVTGESFEPLNRP